MGRSVGTYVPFLRNGRRRPIVFLFVLFVHVVLEFFATGPLLSDALSLRAKAREEPAAGAGASGPDGDPYNIYFTKDKDMKNMRGGTTPQRNDADVEGYTPEARHEVRKWLHGPDNIRGKEHAHGCKSFPFCNHIPPPIGLTPPPWDIPAAMPNPIYPSLSPFPKRLFGKENMYGRDMYTYINGKPHYKTDDMAAKPESRR